LKMVIYNAGIAHGTDDDWEFMWERYVNERDDSEKRKLIRALGTTKETYLLLRLIS